MFANIIKWLAPHHARKIIDVQVLICLFLPLEGDALSLESFLEAFLSPPRDDEATEEGWSDVVIPFSATQTQKLIKACA